MTCIVSWSGSVFLQEPGMMGKHGFIWQFPSLEPSQKRTAVRIPGLFKGCKASPFRDPDGSRSHENTKLQVLMGTLWQFSIEHE